MDIEREKQLIDAIDTLEKEFEKNKWKRTVKTWLFLSIVIYVLAFLSGVMETWLDYALGFIVAPFGAVLYFYINTLIFLPIMNGSTREAVVLERLYAELNLLRRE